MRVKQKTLRSVLSLSIAIAVAGCATAPGGSIQSSQSGNLVSANQSQLSNLDRARAEFSRGNYGNAIQSTQTSFEEVVGAVNQGLELARTIDTLIGGGGFGGFGGVKMF